MTWQICIAWIIRVSGIVDKRFIMHWKKREMQQFMTSRLIMTSLLKQHGEDITKCTQMSFYNSHVAKKFPFQVILYKSQKWILFCSQYTKYLFFWIRFFQKHINNPWHRYICHWSQHEIQVMDFRTGFWWENKVGWDLIVLLDLIEWLKWSLDDGFTVRGEQSGPGPPWPHTK